MEEIKYKKPEKQTIQGICVKCNTNKQTSFGKNKNGETKYKALCSSCHLKRYDLYNEANIKAHKRQRPYRKYKVDVCQQCGFVPVHSCQLDVDHIDGNHSNNNPDNLQTLCANCHRLKTHIK